MEIPLGQNKGGPQIKNSLNGCILINQPSVMLEVNLPSPERTKSPAGSEFAGTPSILSPGMMNVSPAIPHEKIQQAQQMQKQSRPFNLQGLSAPGYGQPPFVQMQQATHSHPQAAAPPPPPPPPPTGGFALTPQTPGMPAPVNTPASGAMSKPNLPLKPFLADIRSNQIVLKKSAGPVPDRKKKPSEGSDVAAILMRRAALEASDSEGDDDGMLL